ncbi:hypothetical protein [Streptomyces sp. NPDC048551]|uniref:hypothetical protein n=1 Tax=Streptomyces sp. NPDC048551 TaxID=3155758 RepID=UPI003418BA1B
MDRLICDGVWSTGRSDELKKDLAKAVSNCPGGPGATCRVNLDTRWLTGAFDDGNGDLTFALRGFNYRQSGSVTMTKLDGGRVRVSGDTRIDFFKNYNFDYGDKFYGVDLGTFAELHRFGCARDYEVHGSKNT